MLANPAASSRFFMIIPSCPSFLAVFIKSFISFVRAKNVSRNLSGVLALELVVNWLAESKLKSKIYLFGYDHKPNGHFHNDLPIPESACGLREYEPFKAAPCVNMSPDSAIPFWPKMSKLPEIEPTTPDEKGIFFRQAKTWLLQKRFTKMGDL